MIVNILTVIALIIIGVNAYLWLSWFREEGSVNDPMLATGSTTITDRKEANDNRFGLRNKMGFNQKGKKRNTRDMSKRKKIKQALNENEPEIDLNNHHMNLDTLGVRKRETKKDFIDGLDDLDGLDVSLGNHFEDLNDDSFIEEKENENVSIEDQFPELFEDVPENERSNNKVDNFKKVNKSEDPVFGSKEYSENESARKTDKDMRNNVFGGNEFNANKKEQNPEVDDLSFLDNYDFEGQSEETIDESVFNKKAKNKHANRNKDLAELERLTVPPIEGINYGVEEERVEEASTDSATSTNNETSDVDEDDIMIRLRRLAEEAGDLEV